MTGQVLRPVEGDPEAVRALARSLRSGATRLAQVNAVLVGIKAGASWDSPAGEVFEAAVQKSPPVVDALIDRYAGAAVALATFAEALEDVQTRVRVAGERHADAMGEHRRLEDLAVVAAADPVAAEAVRRRQGEAMGQVLEAEREHARAWEDFHRADRHLARRLRVLADDVLDDPWHYSVIAGAQEGADEAATMPPALRRTSATGAVAAVGDVVGSVSQVALLVLYGEGSWKLVGVNASARLLGAGAKGLRAGSVAGSRAASSVDGRARTYVGEELSTRQRFVIGSRDELHATSPRAARALGVTPSRMVVPVAALPAMAPTKHLPLGQKLSTWRSHGAAVARRRADTAFLDEWRAVTAGGAGAQRMFVAGVTLQKATPRLTEEATAAVSRKPAE